MSVNFFESDLESYSRWIPAERLNGKRILIAGAGGLIGSALIDFLMEFSRRNGIAVTIRALGRNTDALVRRFSKYLHSEAFRIETADVTEISAFDWEADYMIHAASPSSPLAYSLTPVEVMRANILGTMSLLALARKCGAKMLFVSSGEIYGNSGDPACSFAEEDVGRGEIDILNPRSCYPESKRAAETLCASYRAQFHVEFVTARLCHVYGPSITETNSRADAQFLRNVINGENIVMKSAGSQVRSFCYVKDAVVGILCALLNGADGEAYNVADKNSVATIREYAETLADIGGVGIENQFPSQAEARGYTRIQRAVLNAGKLERLGWMPIYNLKDGLRDTYRQAMEAAGQGGRGALR